MEATLALEDGRIFRGRSFGAPGRRTGEVVFNTSMTGYQEILTDPSYCGQIVVMTYPLIGNCGVNDQDAESAAPRVEGLCVRESSKLHSNWRSRKDLPQYLRENRIPGVTEIDTRALTRHIRSQGAMRGALVSGTGTAEEAVRLARSAPLLGDLDLVGRVTCAAPYTWGEGRDPAWLLGSGTAATLEKRRVVAYDFGIKQNILRHLVDLGCDVTVVPASWPAEDTLAMNPDGVFLSNGPGDPEAAGAAVDVVRSLMGKIPLFGICLGHQILGLALGGATFKLKFGHRGGNHPVRDQRSGKIAITAQNHGYAVDARSLPAAVEVTHVNLNDGTCEGFRHRDLPLFAVQYHPEAAPGPHDAGGLFRDFRDLMAEGEPSRDGEPKRLPADDLGRLISDSKGRRREGGK
ncbi:MAG: glutamine-hydrolyzing carbamoyl-phosphate synthase small subunit [Acidobacteria bacterium]|nr:glutamine-hydrolyzing carbamoyl-phosphate synthase small subunit [Acidobacteriota bacterium]